MSCGLISGGRLINLRAMSRSIHDTRRFLQEALTDNFSDPDLQQELVRAARSNLRQQRSIKEHTRLQRQRGCASVPSLDPEQVPIVVEDQGPFVQHHVTEEDLRELMRRLPPGSLDGLCAIHLCLNSTRANLGRSLPVDPYLRRPGHQLLPGVYASRVLSAYSRQEHAIRLFAYVHAADAVSPAALLLKLRSLAAFVHAGAQHFDSVFRIARDRWRRDDQGRTKGFAHRTELLHTLRVVLPYLEARYPAECLALAAWMRDHGGVALPLAVLIDHREGRQAPMLRALSTLAWAIAAGRDPQDTRVELASALHHAGHDDYTLAVVARVLATHPAHPGALSVRACVAACRGELSLAESTCREVLQGTPACPAAWAVLTRCLRAQGRWHDLLVSATQGVALAGSSQQRWQLQQRARAHLELARWDALAEDLLALRRFETPAAERAAAVLQALMLLRQELFADAFAQANQLLRAPTNLAGTAVLTAIRFESAHRLGRPTAAGLLDRRHTARLCATGHGQWINRLTEEYGIEPLRGRVHTR